eukprot:CAMPEP_0171806466 /NCGR_PEP_ID=MMETSP0991-20121206/75318_1 /TAXON_ID=483369 /ORGANISM="non described non described, Strain CCMP2098" /LENGTH=275 /DNA_ID=CAMNT_0012419225 /DNA_START=18 /DNA_END=843 /DNA_ORIENTATION=+
MNQVTVLAGGGQRTNPGGFLYRDGAVRVALFNSPQGIAVTKDGDLIVADSNRIRKIDNHGQVTTVAGSGSFAFGDGQSSGAHFKNPRGVVVTEEGLIVVADSKNHRIRTVTPEGIVTTLAGSGVAGFADGPGMQAMFDFPRRVAIDRNGNVIVADTNNNRIRIVTQAGQVTTLAGGHNNNRIRTITPEGMVTTLAGSGVAGFADGPGIEAEFNHPHGICIDHNGNVIVADSRNHRVRIVTKAGQVSTLAGSGNADFGDGNGILAHFKGPVNVAVD